jgi:hypothetical protein
MFAMMGIATLIAVIASCVPCVAADPPENPCPSFDTAGPTHYSGTFATSVSSGTLEVTVNSDHFQVGQGPSCDLSGWSCDAKVHGTMTFADGRSFDLSGDVEFGVSGQDQRATVWAFQLGAQTPSVTFSTGQGQRDNRHIHGDVATTGESSQVNGQGRYTLDAD